LVAAIKMWIERCDKAESDRAELLAALQAAYETFAGQRLHHNRNVLGQMLSAIAKARGEQS